MTVAMLHTSKRRALSREPERALKHKRALECEEESLLRKDTHDTAWQAQAQGQPSRAHVRGRQSSHERWGRGWKRWKSGWQNKCRPRINAALE